MAIHVSTERLVLREWLPADRDPFAALNADPEVMEYLPAVMGRAESDAMAEHLAASLRHNGFGLWAVEVGATGEFIGFTGLAVPTFEAPFTPAVEVGWRLARSAWGHGYATEAARGALSVAYGPLALDEVVSFTAAGNVRSRAVMERLAMAHDPADDFDHPRLEPSSPLRRHVLYRLSRPQGAQADR